MKHRKLIPPSSRATRASGPAPVLLFPQNPARAREARIDDLIMRLTQDSPGALDAMSELYEMICGIVARHAGANHYAPAAEEQVDDLLTIALEAVFSGALARPSSLSAFVETLARQWNRIPDAWQLDAPARKPAVVFPLPVPAKVM
jgi:hypothetical protein